MNKILNLEAKVKILEGTIQKLESKLVMLESKVDGNKKANAANYHVG